MLDLLFNNLFFLNIQEVKVQKHFFECILIITPQFII